MEWYLSMIRQMNFFICLITSWICWLFSYLVSLPLLEIERQVFLIDGGIEVPTIERLSITQNQYIINPAIDSCQKTIPQRGQVWIVVFCYMKSSVECKFQIAKVLHNYLFQLLKKIQPHFHHVEMMLKIVMALLMLLAFAYVERKLEH